MKSTKVHFLAWLCICKLAQVFQLVNLSAQPRHRWYAQQGTYDIIEGTAEIHSIWAYTHKEESVGQLGHRCICQFWYYGSKSLHTVSVSELTKITETNVKLDWTSLFMEGSWISITQCLLLRQVYPLSYKIHNKMKCLAN